MLLSSRYHVLFCSIFSFAINNISGGTIDDTFDDVVDSISIIPSLLFKHHLQQSFYILFLFKAYFPV